MKQNMKELLRLDLGCGRNKKPGYIGIDCEKNDMVDIVLDLSHEKLPFEDNSIEYIYSNHFFEHIKNPNTILAEIGRVACAGAMIEIWTPYAHSDDASIFGHEIFYNEEHWQHICVKYPEFWKSIINSRWLLKKEVFIIKKEVYDEIILNGFKIEFALKYFKGISHEFGVFIEVGHDISEKSPKIEKFYSFNRGGELFQLK